MKDKILLHAQNPSKVFLFKEGIFYKVYNQGAYFLRHKKYKLNVKKIKNSENEAVSMGFRIRQLFLKKKTVPIATISKFRDSVTSYLGIMQHHKTFNLKLKTLFKKQPNVLYNYFISNLLIYKIKNNEL